MKADSVIWILPILVLISQIHAGCGPEKPVVYPPADAAVLGVRPSLCSDGKACPANTECGDDRHCPKGKCCEVLEQGNDAGVAAGTRRVVGEPQ